MKQLLYLLSLVTVSLAQGDIDELVLQQIFGTPPNQQASEIPTQAPTFAPTQRPTPTFRPAVSDNLGQSQQPTNQGSNGQTDTASEEIEPCALENGAAGVCVPYYLCNSENNTVITDGSDIIDIRIKDGPCNSYLDLCCMTASTRPPDNPKPPPKPTEERQGCGWRNPNGVGVRITGAKDGEAQFAEFPWMVAILTVEPVDENNANSQRLNVYLGGASLIHPSVVLTAAHYVDKVWGKKTVKVRAGEWDTQTKREAYPYQDRNVKDVSIHKDFNKGNLFYDIAVLFLESPMELAPNVGIVCLPPPRERVRDGTQCFASGWGKDLFEKEGRYQVILKKVELPVVERNKCQSQLRKTRLGSIFELHSSFMCAGGERGKDTCKGDGGSPLVCPIEYEPGRYMQSGIVAWGIGCGQDGTPGVYVDVSVLRDWIDNEVAGKGYTISSYSIDARTK